jgi:hypothetical protein
MDLTFIPSSPGYISRVVCKNSCPFLMLPYSITDGSMSTYYCDYNYSTSTDSNERTLWLGGRVGQKESVGLFSITLQNMNYFASEFTGSRLMYIP